MKIFYPFLVLAIVGINHSYATNCPILCHANKASSPNQVVFSHDEVFGLAKEKMIDTPTPLTEEEEINSFTSFYWTCKICNYGRNLPWNDFCRICERHCNES